MSPIKRNPFEVGHSGGVLETRNFRCSCCDLPFRAKVRTGEVEYEPHCDRCVPHRYLEGESLDRRLERLGEHEPRIHGYARAAADAATRMEHERNAAKQSVAGAPRSRDRWRNIIIDLSAQHQESGRRKCSACGVAWPCPTVKVIQADRSLAKDAATRAFRSMILNDDY